MVCGRDVAEHDMNLAKVLQRAKEVNLKLKVTKCKFRLESVSYVGHLFTKDGLKPDDEKIKAIKEMPVPENRKALQRFLGMLNYLHKFIENFSEKTTILRQLLRKDVQWCWQVEHQVAFEKLKDEISNPLVLKFEVRFRSFVGAIGFSNENGRITAHNVYRPNYAKVGSSYSTWLANEVQGSSIRSCSIFSCKR